MSATIVTGQFTLPAAGSQPARVTTAVEGSDGFSLRALSGNVATIYIGPQKPDGTNNLSSSNGFPLAPGESMPIDLLNPGQFYAVGTVGDKLAFIALKP